MKKTILQKIKQIFNKSMVDVSVVVPIYNVEEYLFECLESIENQTLKNIQVIMIDDGSTDNSGEIAIEYTKTHPRFEYHRIENQGLGHARNYAMQFVKGKYFVFIDSDDIVAPDAYQNLFEAAEKHNASFAICNVARFNSKKTFASSLHNKVFKQLSETTHIFENHNLINDTTSWNKLILKRFWDKHKFKFPEGILYEDIPVTIPMHCLAQKVAVVDKIGYFWRMRDGATNSITQNTQNMQNFYDRIQVLKMVDEFFKANVKNDLLTEEKNIKTLEIDLLIFINNCNLIPEQQAYEIFEIIQKYIKETMPLSTFDKLSVIHKQKYTCVMNNDLSGLVKVLENQNKDYYNAPIEEKDGKFFITCSEDVFPIKDRDVTAELQKVTPNKYINDIISAETSIDVLAHLYIPRVNISDFSQQNIEAYLLNEKTGYHTPLKVTSIKNTQLTANKGLIYNPITEKTYQYNYDGTGFKISLDINDIEINESNIGSNRVAIKYKNRVSEGTLFLGNADKNISTKIQDNTVIADNNILRLSMSMFNELIVELTKETTFVEKTKVKNNNLEFHLNTNANKIFAQDNYHNIVEFKTKNNLIFTCPLENFTADNYNFYIEKASGEKDFLTRKTKAVKIYGTNDNVVVLMSNKSLRLSAKILPSCTKISSISQNNNVISITTEYLGKKQFSSDIKEANIVVDDEIAKTTVSLAKATCNNEDDKYICDFKIDFDNEEITKNLFESYRLVYVEYSLSNGDVIREPLCTQKYFKFGITFETLAIDLYRYNGVFVRLYAKLLWKKDESTKEKRQVLIDKHYPEYRKLPLNSKCIVFESMWGKKYSCNPKHLYEYIDKNYPEYECVWFLSDPRTPINGNGKRVRRGSLEYFYYLATAKYFINNVNFEDAYEKRDGQIEVQTMHGTPLKTFGFDVKGELETETQKQNYIRRNSRWNYLVVQGDFMAEKAFPCFGCNTPILKTGYPRTDTLFENNTEDKIKEIKEKLNLPLNKKVIVYTPTWRIKNKFDMQLDIEKMRNKLSDDYILLIRIHLFSAAGYTVPADNQFVFDFNKYHTVEDLYLIADILITDYSSVMFDYGVLRKPMMFFTYDIREYADNLRGMYFDIEKEAPGPLVYTSDELISAILNIDEEMAKCKGRIDAFNNKYVNFEAPDSCQRIFETVLDPKNDLEQ